MFKIFIEQGAGNFLPCNCLQISQQKCYYRYHNFQFATDKHAQNQTHVLIKSLIMLTFLNFFSREKMSDSLLHDLTK